MIQWIKFWMLAVIWGSSFLLIKVAVDDLGALPLVSIRLGGAALLFSIYLFMTRRKLPAWGDGLGVLLFVGVFNTAVPFFLISWGETKIDSGLATVLNSSVPLFNLVIAHFLISDERLTQGKIIGLILGFIGVVIVVSHGIDTTDNPILGQVAVLGASLCYALSIALIRHKLRHLDAFTTAGYSTLIGAVPILIATVLFVNPLPDFPSLDFEVIAAGITLAIVNTFVAYFLFYDLISNWGVRASLVTYAMPPIGVTLGFLVLDEVIDWRLLVGGALILTGIILAKKAASPTQPTPARTETFETDLKPAIAKAGRP